MNNNELINIPDIHIGNEIKSYLKVRGISQANIARAIGRPTSNLTRITKRKSIESSLLVEISNAAGYNFFSLWCKELLSDCIPSLPINIQVPIGKIIQDSIHINNMTQSEFASHLGICHSDIPRIVKRTSIETDRIAQFSRILGQNLFIHFCLNEMSYKKTAEKTASSESLLIDRLEKLAIENSRLKQELREARLENAKLRYTV